MNLKTVIALAIAAAFAAPVAAQTSSGTDNRVTGGTNAPAAASGFSALDRNNDGYISRDEAREAAWSNRFTEFDKDNDDRLSRSEFDAMQAAAGASTTGGMGGSVGPGGTQSGSSTSGVGDKPGQKQ
jgi:hypothetical protein